MKLTIRNRTIDDINEFLTWTYDGLYSFYDNNIQQEKMDGFKQSIYSDRAFSVVYEEDQLIGNCEFFDVGDDGEELLAVGVQMKPSLTGQGHGSNFIQQILEQGRDVLKFNHLELAVVDFHQRAIKVYENVGFKKKGEFENEIRGHTYKFIIMEKDW